MLIYKIFQILIILLFAFFVSDLRRKNVTKELLNGKLILLMKIIYIIPLLIFLISVINSDELLITDIISMSFTIVGLVIVILAKLTLGVNHSWTGYGTFPEEFLRKGIFSKIRHPMYTGIFICIFGMWFHVFWHATLLLAIINFSCSLFIFYVLISSARKETEHLINLFGDDYEHYANRVHPFLPIK